MAHLCQSDDSEADLGETYSSPVWCAFLFFLDFLLLAKTEFLPFRSLAFVDVSGHNGEILNNSLCTLGLSCTALTAVVGRSGKERRNSHTTNRSN